MGPDAIAAMSSPGTSEIISVTMRAGAAAASFAMHLLIARQLGAEGVGLFALALAAMGLDMVTAFSASAASLGNIGPGFGHVGPTLTYAPLPAAAKLLFVALMIVGRLELYTMLVLFFLWRRLK